MGAERDHLVRHVFPRLRETLLRRGMDLVDVDLRWGVTAEQNSIELCVDEIDRCRPRFLCLLGGRYGWVPPPGSLPQALAEAAGRSITASEVHYGALRDLDRPMFHSFYFRDAAVTEEASRDVPEYQDPPGSQPALALEALKRTIRQTSASRLVAPGVIERRPLQVFEYPCRWDPATRRIVELRALGDRVYQDLLASVEAEYGPAEPGPANELAEEREAAERFIQASAEEFVTGSRAGALAELVAHVEGAPTNGYACVVGEAGSGKSALIARCLAELGARSDGPTLLLPHFVGVNRSAPRAMLQRLCRELAAGLGDEEPVPDAFDRLAAALDRLLSRVGGRRVVIALDAVDQLEPAHDAGAMRWLPRHLPPGVRIVLSARPGAALEALRERCDPVLVLLAPLDPQRDAGPIIDGYLRRYRKSLDAEQRALLLAKEGAGNPLYLRTALEELRTLGTYEEITERIRALPGRTDALFDWVLRRLEADDSFRDAAGRLVGGSLVRNYCGFLAASRQGMAHAELVELAAPADPARSAAADPEGNAAALQRLLRPYLLRRGELLVFHHVELRDAVLARYLPDPEAHRRTHGALAGYFRRRGERDPRCLTELVHHLVQAGDDDALIALTNGSFPEAKLDRLGSVAEVAQDYAAAIDACARRDDLPSALAFAERRSLLSARAAALAEPGAARAIARLATVTEHGEEVQRAEALAREFLAPGVQACVLGGLARGLPRGPDRERLLRDALRLVERLPEGEERDAAADAVLDAALAHDDAPEDVARLFDLTRTGESARGRAALWRACARLRAGDAAGADTLLGEARAEWRALPDEFRRETLAVAAAALRDLNAPDAALSALRTALPGLGHRDAFLGLFAALRLGRDRWVREAIDRLPANSPDGPSYPFGLGLLRTLAIDPAHRRVRLMRRAGRMVKAMDFALSTIGALAEALVTVEFWDPPGEGAYNSLLERAEWKGLGLAAAVAGARDGEPGLHHLGRLVVARARAGTPAASRELGRALERARAARGRADRRKDLLEVVEAAAECGVAAVGERALASWTADAFDRREVRVARWGTAGETVAQVGMLAIVVFGVWLAIRVPIRAAIVGWTNPPAGMSPVTPWIAAAMGLFVIGALSFIALRLVAPMVGRSVRQALSNAWLAWDTRRAPAPALLARLRESVDRAAASAPAGFARDALIRRLRELAVEPAAFRETLAAPLRALLERCVERHDVPLGVAIGIAAFRAGDRDLGEAARQLVGAHGSADEAAQLAGARAAGLAEEGRPGQSEPLEAAACGYAVRFSRDLTRARRLAFEGIRLLAARPPAECLSRLREIVDQVEERGVWPAEVIEMAARRIALPKRPVRVGLQLLLAPFRFLAGFATLAVFMVITMGFLGPTILAGLGLSSAVGRWALQRARPR